MTLSAICYYYIVARPNIFITPVLSTSRLFNVLPYPHVNSSADYEMPHFRRIPPGQYKRTNITLEASTDRQQSSVAIRLVRPVLRRWTHAGCHAVVMTVENQKGETKKKERDRGTVGGPKQTGRCKETGL